jgi:hypothetical protein
LIADFRRSGAVEAIAGGAKAEELAHAMGNTLSASNALFATYVPVNQATLRTVLEARRRGRSKLRDRTKRAQKSERGGPKSRNADDGAS